MKVQNALEENERLTMKYSVKTLRAAGLEARWTRTSAGAPIIVCRDPKSAMAHARKTWWTVGQKMWDAMLKDGIVDAFNNHVFIGDIFSIPA